MKRLGLITIPMLLLALLLAFRPAEGQDNLQDRVSALETRVATLEAQVTTSPTSPRDSTLHTISGKIVLTGSIGFTNHEIDASGTTCSGAGGYSDIHPGADVIVQDGAGTTIALGRLGEGEWDRTEGNNGTCTISFSVGDVPDTDFYTITIGNRDGLLMSRSDLEAVGWTLEFSLGSA